MHNAGAFSLVYAGLLGLALLLPRPSAAAWPDEPLVNVPLCTAPHDQDTPASVSDGAGGAIVVWQDRRGDSDHDIYAQHISADGTVQWAGDGVALCGATGDQTAPTVVSDGAGGAIVVWQDRRGDADYDIYAQHISAAGAVQWAANGVALCAATGDQQTPTIASDGAGGAIVAWRDSRNGSTNDDVYAQRISAAGVVQWTADGAALCVASGSQVGPRIVSDGVGGAIVAWSDFRSDADYDIYAQHVLAGGAVDPDWTADGVALCTATGDQVDPMIVSDDAQGAVVVWGDGRGVSTDVYARRIAADGAPLWTADGVPLCTAIHDQQHATIVSDGSGGAIVTWDDYRSDANCNIYARRITSAGAPLWTVDGVALCAAAGTQDIPIIVTDGAGGAIVTWTDSRNADPGVYSQRISAGGTVLWTADGVAISTATGGQGSPSLVSDGAGGAIVAWQDSRNGSTNLDIYAQRVWANGSTPVLLSLVSADVTAQGIKLEWFMGGSGSDVATVYRSSVEGEWTRIRAVTADGSGYLRYTDPIDATATRVGYRLGIVDAGVEGFYGETWVDLPARDAEFAFALDPARPNPTPGGALTVRFTLPTAAPARIELVDVSGRRVVEREVGSLGAGRHTLVLGQGQHLAPGLYLVRLTQGANTRTTRVAAL